MNSIEIASRKIDKGERLNFTEALALYQHNDILKLAELARMVKERKSGQYVYYNVNRHINLTNICVSGCPLCAFGCKAEEQRAYVMQKSEVIEIVSQTMRETPDLSEIHMVSALHPDKPFSYYLDIVAAVKRAAPQVHLKAFTPVEIVHFANISQLGITAVLEQLKAAGLDSLPGGGAEILDDSVRKIICPNKATTAEWIDVITAAHSLGLPTNATMLYGHVETIEQRIQHLITLRDIQDRTGKFQAFIAFPFHPANTGFTNLQRVSSWEDLKMISLARLVLDNFDHIKAFWMMLTLPIAQLALTFGADDLDGTVVEEKIIHAAGATTKKGITKKEIISFVEETGYLAVERDTFYRPLKISSGVKSYG
ncbi:MULTISPECIES: aminofutalosine synthase MqnE [Pelosinus]|jgi:aminodeoxyfutalosine synthase|uniref:Aminodeoxyfutalosine synthase n=1 Tax=Pelosinus fermentans B4 TaxID=1149862 RepID=I8RM84_9FIRM|nr:MULTISPECIES: aminofutalosine synthase MqnE [Pelosinus]EIW19890.1 putative menaquinone biosynthesis protein [Pelosinus fermentans B4]EIW21253.1 FO synthase, subunit 2 [Pelosinus fermentans A11]OAM95045.1 putative menaquinone biosynthesis protein [Pelosinus fermentans DSM 17108]SDR22469.1 aminodeoxyfutalosine synthase [Pelosinus fermentans]